MNRNMSATYRGEVRMGQKEGNREHREARVISAKLKRFSDPLFSWAADEGHSKTEPRLFCNRS